VTPPQAPLLQVQALSAAYGRSRVLFDVDLQVQPGEIVGLLGRNGMGKTTLVRHVAGLMRPVGGQVHFAGQDMTGQPAYRVAQLGLGLVPEGRQVFANLSVEEHLSAFHRAGSGGAWTPARLFELFPRLAERRGHLGNQLSGGEQQMLAIARALVTNPRLLILDEATEGLAPLIRLEIWNCLQRLKEQGLALIVIDKNIGPLLRLADRHYVVEKGRIVWQGTSAELRGQPEVVAQYLGV